MPLYRPLCCRPVSANALTLISALSVATLSVFFSFKPASAQELPPLPVQFNPDTLQNPGRPGGRRRGGGSRGGCAADNPLTAIAYADSRQSEELGVTRTDETVGSLTTQSQPMLWFYLPEPISGGTTAELTIKNSADEPVFQGSLIGQTDSDGIIGIPMGVSLEPGQAYHWFLSLECDESESTTVDGWLERRTPNADLSRTFNQATARNRVALYANYGFVQDALSELAALRLADPEDEAIAQDWVNFLSDLELTDLTAAPLLDCCQVANAEDSRTDPNDEETDEIDDATPEPSEELAPTAPAPEPAEEPERRTILQRARDRG